MFCSHKSSNTIKNEFCRTINSFSLREEVSGVSGDKSLVSVKDSNRVKGLQNSKIGIKESSSESVMEIESL
jgi:hypothetical protein